MAQIGNSLGVKAVQDKLLADIARVRAGMKQRALTKLEGLTLGLKKAGLFLQGESMRIVPVDKGNLRASAFTRSEGDNTPNVDVTVGYTANYAIFVHENLDAAHGAAFNAKYARELAHARSLRRRRKGGTTGPFAHNRGENQQAKFLESPLRWNKDKIRDMVRVAVKSR